MFQSVVHMLLETIRQHGEKTDRAANQLKASMFGLHKMEKFWSEARHS